MTTLQSLATGSSRCAGFALLALAAGTSGATGAAGAAGAAGAQPVATLLPAQSEIVFTTRQMGVPVEGRFGRFEARIALDPRQPERGSVALRIDTGSARFGSAELDTEVVKPGWLAAAKFPQASFQSSAIRATGPGRFEVTGRLSLKGSVRELVVPVQLQGGGAAGTTSTTSTASGSFTLKRLEFKVGEDEWADTALLANEVAVRFKLVLGGLVVP